MNSSRSLYRTLFLIRRFEETVLAEFKRGVFSGTTHTCLGQEANAVGVLSQIQTDDIVVSNHRSHGHFLAYGGDPFSLFAELMGKSAGVCGGRGGSQHLHWRNFYSNGILGGTLPVATGMALAEKFKQSHAVVVTFMGDGALGQGVVYESFNMAALWQLPILFIIENNHIAQTTPTTSALAGGIDLRLKAFGIEYHALDTSDVEKITGVSLSLLDMVRKEQVPFALELNTERFGPHSKGDDTRTEAYLASLRQERDPLKIQAQRLDSQDRLSVEAEVDALIKNAFTRAIEAEGGLSEERPVSDANRLYE
jgi:TPP-dependent pyruvate/acetoin dehydrogenase alpha subunit